MRLCREVLFPFGFGRRACNVWVGPGVLSFWKCGYELALRIKEEPREAEKVLSDAKKFGDGLLGDLKAVIVHHCSPFRSEVYCTSISPVHNPPQARGVRPSFVVQGRAWPNGLAVFAAACPNRRRASPATAAGDGATMLTVAAELTEHAVIRDPRNLYRDQ